MNRTYRRNSNLVISLAQNESPLVLNEIHLILNESHLLLDDDHMLQMILNITIYPCGLAKLCWKNFHRK